MMGKMHIAELFARNLRTATEVKYGLKPDGEVNQSALHRDSGVSQKAISNYLSALKPENNNFLDQISSPSIMNLAKLANALSVEPWELLHPDPEKAKREREFYLRIERDFSNLPPLDPQQDWPQKERRHHDRRANNHEET